MSTKNIIEIIINATNKAWDTPKQARSDIRFRCSMFWAFS